MAILLAYYSRTGATKKAAQAIARILNCETEEISDVKSRAGILGYLISGLEAVQKKLPAVKDVKHDPKSYDLVIIGTPNWAGNMASPVRTYLTQAKGKIKRFALMVTQGGRGAERAIKDMENVIGQSAETSLVLSTKEVMTDFGAEKINLFIEQIKKISL